ncbi:hypothetical protein H310_04734 [Aphanomyces invadans]|uniref:Uncharacterized protein n=1 Tax=Aphanomyces invadans TaxID=157072 RepID=A0A024UE46_9STRA|nr:hypothetical protein H310_04734 [Aphanomyces invadans]ETW04460.1 hypothetical protein H310_04734 [Aphanomyces invadans]|eukprot:XP_008867416.1 hypothetical protein H310_04734 [Aphanomyces invadans]
MRWHESLLLHLERHKRVQRRKLGEFGEGDPSLVVKDTYGRVAQNSLDIGVQNLARRRRGKSLKLLHTRVHFGSTKCLDKVKPGRVGAWGVDGQCLNGRHN